MIAQMNAKKFDQRSLSKPGNFLLPHFKVKKECSGSMGRKIFGDDKTVINI